MQFCAIYGQNDSRSAIFRFLLHFKTKIKCINWYWSILEIDAVLDHVFLTAVEPKHVECLERFQICQQFCHLGFRFAEGFSFQFSLQFFGEGFYLRWNMVLKRLGNNMQVVHKLSDQ